MLRRVDRLTEPVATDAPTVALGPVTLDPVTHRVTIDGAEVHLTPTEFDLARTLAASPERVFTREELDAWALRSHLRAVEAQRSGAFAGEITPVVIRERKSERVVEQDQGPREDSTLEALGKLAPLTEGGTHTAGNSPGVTDGAAMLVAMSEERAAELGAMPLAFVRASGVAADETRRLACAPASALESALAKAGLTIVEVPITFVERVAGVSKMSGAIVQEAMLLVTKWGIAKRSGDLRRALRLASR